MSRRLAVAEVPTPSQAPTTVSTPTSAPTATRVPPTATATEEPKTHTVQPGEGWSQIAASYGVSQSELLAANGLSQPATIHPGDVLQLPGSSSAVARPPTTAATKRPSVPTASPRPPTATPIPATATPVPKDVVVAASYECSAFSRYPGEPWPDLNSFPRVVGIQCVETVAGVPAPNGQSPVYEGSGVYVLEGMGPGGTNIYTVEIVFELTVRTPAGSTYAVTYRDPTVPVYIGDFWPPD